MSQFYYSSTRRHGSYVTASLRQTHKLESSPSAQTVEGAAMVQADRNAELRSRQVGVDIDTLEVW